MELMLVDVDLSPLLDRVRYSAIRRRTAWDLLQQELDGLIRSVTSLSGLQTLMLHSSKGRQSVLLMVLRRSFLVHLQQDYPQISCLQGHDAESTIRQHDAPNDMRYMLRHANSPERE